MLAQIITFVYQKNLNTYDSKQAIREYISPVYSAEYQTNANEPLSAVVNPACIVCCTSRVSVLVIPAHLSCPATWTLECCGYPMTANKIYRRRSTACVDKDPETLHFVPGEAADTNGALFYHTEPTCSELACPPYDPQKELTCVVCTK